MTGQQDQGWFYAKRYGFGASIPRTWQGWLVTILFLGAIALAGIFLLPVSPLAFVAIFIFLTVCFVVIAWKTTKGGWRWRWGKDEGTW